MAQMGQLIDEQRAGQAGLARTVALEAELDEFGDWLDGLPNESDDESDDDFDVLEMGRAGRGSREEVEHRGRGSGAGGRWHARKGR